MDGWIKLHRSILETRYWGDHKTTLIWIYLLLRANYKEKRGYRGENLGPGEVFTGTLRIADDCNIGQSSVQRILKKLEKEGQIKQRTTNRYRIISIVNWKQFQAFDFSSSYMDTKFNYYDEDFRKLRLQVFLRDGEICATCGARPEPGLSLTIDHIKPVSKFPELARDISNLQVLCWDCNQSKSDKV